MWESNTLLSTAHRYIILLNLLGCGRMCQHRCSLLNNVISFGGKYDRSVEIIKDGDTTGTWP